MFESFKQISNTYPEYEIKTLSNGHYSTFFYYMKHEGLSYKYRFDYALDMISKMLNKNGTIILFKYEDEYLQNFLKFFHNERYTSTKKDYHQKVIKRLRKILKENNIIIIFDHRYQPHFDQSPDGAYKDVFSYYDKSKFP